MKPVHELYGQPLYKNTLNVFLNSWYLHALHVHVYAVCGEFIWRGSGLFLICDNSFQNSKLYLFYFNSAKCFDEKGDHGWVKPSNPPPPFYTLLVMYIIFIISTLFVSRGFNIFFIYQRREFFC
jgi:hypothetical protein